jgi:hypothetical protein
MMITRDEHVLSWYVRCAWHRLAGVPEPEYALDENYGKGRHRLPVPEVMRDECWSREFEQLMRNRLLMGAFRYGLFSDQRASGTHYDSVASAIAHLVKYIRTGNSEHLVDAANLCLVEFVRPTQESHFSAVDDGEHAEKLK